MKVIDLLNKIANGEEVPKKIEYRNIKFLYDKDNKLYIVENYNEYNDLLMELSNHKGTDLNYEVEILEEQKKIPEKLEGINSLFKIEQDLDLKGFLAWQKANNKMIENKINSIIDYLESKGE